MEPMWTVVITTVTSAIAAVAGWLGKTYYPDWRKESVEARKRRERLEDDEIDARRKAEDRAFELVQSVRDVLGEFKVVNAQLLTALQSMHAQITQHDQMKFSRFDAIEVKLDDISDDVAQIQTHLDIKRRRPRRVAAVQTAAVITEITTESHEPGSAAD